MTRRSALRARSLPAAFFAALIAGPATAQSPVDIEARFATAENAGLVGAARKTKPVDARPARPGEVVVTVIRGEGRETQSAPADAGDMVVRNRCAETGNEEILVKAGKFAERYDAMPPERSEGDWKPFRPRGNEMKFFTVPADEAAFTFTAPWGEAMVAKPGDAIVRDAADAKDTYRIARAAFACTYEIVTPPKAR